MDVWPGGQTPTSSSPCLILDSFVGLSAGIQSAGDSVPETLGSNPAFNRGRQPFDSISLPCCQFININNKHVYRQSQGLNHIGNGAEWAECLLTIRMGYRVQVFAWSSIAQLVCRWAFGLLEIRFQRPWVRILHSAEEDNLSPSVSISLPCCQCIKINANKYVHLQSQGWSHISSGVGWAECSLIIGTGYRVQVCRHWGWRYDNLYCH